MQDNSDKQNAKYLGSVKDDPRMVAACVNFCKGHEIGFLENNTLLEISRKRRLSLRKESDALPTLRALERDMALDALKKLMLMAMTSGGTAGPDKGLMDAIDEAERTIMLIDGEPASYFIGTENGIADIDTPPSDN